MLRAELGCSSRPSEALKDRPLYGRRVILGERGLNHRDLSTNSFLRVHPPRHSFYTYLLHMDNVPTLCEAQGVDGSRAPGAPLLRELI